MRLVEYAENKHIRPYLPADFGNNAREMLREPVVETDIFIPEVFWARYSAQKSAEKKAEFLAKRRGKPMQTEILIADVAVDGDSITLIAHSGGNVEIKVDYKMYPLEEKYRPGETVLIIGHIREITQVRNGASRCVIAAEADEIRRIPPEGN